MHGFHRHPAACALTALALAAVMGTAQGSGFQIREQSATGLGSSMAGVSAGGAAGDISTAAYNPAVVGFGRGNAISLFGSYIMPTFDITDAQATDSFGQPRSGDPDQEGSEDAFVPALAAQWQLDDAWALGLVTSAPWGLKTDYDEDWAGRFYGVESELATININPIVSFKASDRLQLAAGIQAQYADATLSNKVDYNVALFNATGGAQTAPGTEGLAEVEGDDWAFGFNLGLLYQPTEATRVGVAYRSRIDHELEGDATFGADDSASAGVRDTLRAGGNGIFNNGSGRADIELPAVLSAGIAHSLSDRWTLLGEVSWTEWSTFDELRVEFDDDNTPDSVKKEDWDDTYMVAAGAEYRLDGRWTLRAGVGFDESPVPDDTRSPRIPDSDRTWASFGATFAPSDRFSVTGAYTRVELDDASIDLDAGDEGNAARGSLTADTEGSVDIVAIQANWRF